MHECLDVREIEEGTPDEAEEKGGVDRIQEPAREEQVMGVHLARHDVKGKRQALCPQERAEEEIPPDGEVGAPQGQDAEQDENDKRSQCKFIMVNHEKSPKRY